MLQLRCRSIAFLCFGSIFAVTTSAQDEPPRSTDPRLKIELFAESPQIVTPTGIDVDQAGRVWAIESNTHFPPEGYKGHPSDRILVMEGRDKAGRVDKITVFKDGLTHTMSVAVKPVWLDVGHASEKQSSSVDKKPAIEVFLATRREIFLCTDTDGDLKCDDVKRLVHLETTGNYPHNGLAGFAFDALGNMFFGFGENLGADYKIIGSDGITLSGGGEGGNIYRCRPDGSKLERWATGFWNPHASCIDAFGRMFSLDNDPDSRPPCRLLHIIPGGDYGYRFRNGRKGTHPFTAWNGEIPGTLPMVSGTGEAPSGIVSYESNGFPEEYLGTLLVGSWGDHRIDKFVLKPRGASFESIPQPVIKGGENFRPVGLAVAPDGSMYVTDWVSKEYKLHGLGRVWRISAKETPSVSTSTSVDAMSIKQLIAALEDRSLTVRRHAARRIEASEEFHAEVYSVKNDKQAENAFFPRDEPEIIRKLSPRARYELLCASAIMNLGIIEYGPFSFHRRTSRGRDVVDATYLRLLDPARGLPLHENVFPSQFAMFWREQFDPQEVQVGPGVWYELARRENLVRLAFETQCATGLVEYVDPVAKYLADPDPFIFSALIDAASRTAEVSRSVEARWDHAFIPGEGMRLLTVLAARGRSTSQQRILLLGLKDPSPRVRRAAVQWAAEEKLTGFRPEVERVLSSEPMTTDLFLACLASLSMLDGVPPAEFEKSPPSQYLLAMVKDSARTATLRATALRMLSPAQKDLDAKLLGEMLGSQDVGLRREAIRTLQHSPIAERDQLLRGIAADETVDATLRADAIAGLASVDPHAKLSSETLDLLLRLIATDKDVALRLEAIRSLRGPAVTPPTQSNRVARVTEVLKQIESQASSEPEATRQAVAEAVKFALGNRQVRPVVEVLAEFSSSEDTKQETEKPTATEADTEAGRRTFFHVNGAGCYKCHTVGGRGGQVGPDLTVIARTMDRKKLAESVLEPSKEISPQFTSWTIETVNGKVLTGMLLGEEVNGDLRMGNSQGDVFFVPFKEIESRSPTKLSIMPEKLHETMTATEFRNLIAFLETLK